MVTDMIVSIFYFIVIVAVAIMKVVSLPSVFHDVGG